MEKRKQLTFDIDTNVAKEILGEQNYTSVYANIRKFMKDEGWQHIEGSVYMSKTAMSNAKVLLLVSNLKKQYPYLTKCIRDMHQSDISNVHGLHKHFEYDGTAGKFALQEKQQDIQKADKPKSIKNRLAEKKEYVKQRDDLQNKADTKIDQKINKENFAR